MDGQIALTTALVPPDLQAWYPYSSLTADYLLSYWERGFQAEIQVTSLFNRYEERDTNQKITQVAPLKKASNTSLLCDPSAIVNTIQCSVSEQNQKLLILKGVIAELISLNIEESSKTHIPKNTRKYFKLPQAECELCGVVCITIMMVLLHLQSEFPNQDPFKMPQKI